MTTVEEAEEQGLPPLAEVERYLTHIGPFDFNVMVDALHQQKVETPDGEEVHAFRVDLVAILPEQTAAALMGMVKEGRVKVRLEPPDEG